MCWLGRKGGVSPFNANERLFLNKASLAEAEPLMQRALAIDEGSFGAEHSSDPEPSLCRSSERVTSS